MSAPPPAVDLSRPHAPSRRAFAHGAAVAPTASAPTAGRVGGSARSTSAGKAAAARPAAAVEAAEAEAAEAQAVAGRWEVTHVGGAPMSLVLPTATAAAPHWGDGTDSGGGFVALAFRGDGTAALERAPSPPPPLAASKTKRKR